MDSTVFKYKHHYQQQQQQQHQQPHYQQNFNNNGSSTNNNNYNQNNNNNKQNSIFILNTTTNSILPNNNPKLFYTDLNENNNVSSSPSSSSSNNTATAGAAATSMWLSASSTMCSPAAHAIQKLFNCSSSSLKSNQGNYRGIETKSYKTKSELLKKKTKIWKYLEGEEEVNDKTNQPGIENEKEIKKKKSLKYKTKYWLKSSCESDNQTNQDLAELLKYSCSLCDNCQCMDCQIAYFDCDNSDDSNSEYSFHLSAYEEDDDNDERIEEEQNKEMELISTKENLNNNLSFIEESNCHVMDHNSKDQLESKSFTYCAKDQSCQQCLLENDLNQQ